MNGDIQKYGKWECSKSVLTVEREGYPGQPVFKNIASHEEGKVTEDFSSSIRRRKLNPTLLLKVK